LSNSPKSGPIIRLLWRRQLDRALSLLLQLLLVRQQHLGLLTLQQLLLLLLVLRKLLMLQKLLLPWSLAGLQNLLLQLLLLLQLQLPQQLLLLLLQELLHPWQSQHMVEGLAAAAYMLLLHVHSHSCQGSTCAVNPAVAATEAGTCASTTRVPTSQAVCTSLQALEHVA
jgi:hypothetical protein